MYANFGVATSGPLSKLRLRCANGVLLSRLGRLLGLPWSWQEISALDEASHLRGAGLALGNSTTVKIKLMLPLDGRSSSSQACLLS